jgi:dihydroceramidase|eukprot:TRINITY_DN7518_c0_g1_i1.p1 TRINITY_DN7518_c0_g1~~TRINITY_DN7518_c0_g1_i1.p1  ORF type:complete len:303 (-),score=37.65 TRINITY_DN7518_c0_g1_i1:84-992(-)
MAGAVSGDSMAPPSHDGVSLMRITIGAIFVGIVPLLGLMVARGPVDGAGDSGAGFWGAKTANVNWCESDYVVTHYLAEFGNAISSCSIIVLGVYGLVMHWKKIETRFVVSFITFLVVGVGSFSFHATLWRSLQLLDELPMVWGNSVFLYVIIAMEDKREAGARRVLAVAMSIVLSFATVLIVLFDTEDQTIFLVCYASGAVGLFGSTAYLTFKHYSRTTVMLLETSVICYGGGFVLWLVDRNFCPVVRSLQLHAIWHFGAGIGTFTSVISWIWMRHECLGDKPVLRGSTPATRWVEIPGKAV